MNRFSDAFNHKHMENIRRKVEKQTGATIRRSAPRRAAARAGIAFAVFVVFCLTATSALAMGVPAVNDLLYLVLPEAAQFFKPVQKSAVDQGIEVSVESAYIHGAEAEAVVSVRDLTGNRLDDTIDLYDSYDIQTGFDSLGSCKQIGYDAATNTATFLIWMKSMRSSDIIRGEKITITVQTLLSGRTEALDVPIELDWSAIPETAKTETADPYEYDVLAIGEEQQTVYEGFTVTGTGYVEGKLHIQLYTPGRNLYDDHAFLYLLDGNGTKTYADMFYRGGYNTGDLYDETRADHIDYVFDVPRGELPDCALYGDFYRADKRVDGYWSVTFPLENQG